MNKIIEALSGAPYHASVYFKNGDGCEEFFASEQEAKEWCEEMKNTHDCIDSEIVYFAELK